MSRVWSILLIAAGGYLLFQNRFRIMNKVLGNRFFRKFIVSFLMSIPFIKNRILKTVFSPPAG